MTLKYNTAETGTNGNTVTTSDTGFPAWDVAPVGTSGAMTYSNSGGCIRGTLCYSFSQGVTAAASYVGWNVNGGASNATQYIRFYVDPADCSGAVILSRGMTSSAGTQTWRLTISGGSITVRDSTNGSLYSSGVMSSGTRYRVEFYFDGGASANTRLIFYVGESSTTSYDSGVQTGANLGTTQHVRFGIASAQASVSCKVDDPSYSDTSPLGAVIQTLTPNTGITSAVRFGTSTTSGSLTVGAGGGIKCAGIFGNFSVAGPTGQGILPKGIDASAKVGKVQLSQLPIVANSITQGGFGNPTITRNIIKGRNTSLTRSPIDRRDPALKRLPRQRKASTIAPFGVKWTASGEGGTNGNNVTTTDSVSGQPFTQSNNGTGTTFTYSSAVAIHGSLGYLAVSTGTAASSYRGWTTSGFAFQWHRIYLDSANQITGANNIPLARGGDVSNNQCWRLTYNNDKTLNFRNGVNSAIITTPPLTDGQPVRVEWMVQGDTNGIARLLVYNLDDLTPTYDSGEVTDNYTGAVYNVRFGITNAVSNLTAAFDDFGWSDITWLGPVQSNPTPKGIASGAKLGNPTVSRANLVTGIPSTGKFGNPTVANSGTIRPVGVPGREGVGSPGFSAVISAQGFSNDPIGNSTVFFQLPQKSIARTDRVGNSTSLSTYTISASGIPSATRLGNASAAPTSTVSAFGIGSAGVLGNFFQSNSRSIVPSGIASNVRFGASTVQQLLSPFGISSDGRLGSIATAKGIVPNGITTNAQTGNITITTTRTVTVLGIGSQQRFGNSTTATTITVNANGVPTAQSAGLVVTGLSVRPIGIPSKQSVGYTATTIIDLINSIPSQAKLGAAVVTSTYTVTPNGIPTAVGFGNAVQGSTRTINPNGIPCPGRFGNPTLAQQGLIAGIPSNANVGPGNTIYQTSAKGIVGQSVVGNASVTNFHPITPKSITAPSGFGNPSIALSTTVFPAGVSSQQNVSPIQSASTIVQTKGIESKQSLGAVSISRTLLPAGIGSSQAVGKPTATPGSVSVTVKGIGSGTYVSEPGSIINANVLHPVGIRSVTAFGGGNNVHFKANVDSVVGPYSFTSPQYDRFERDVPYDLEDDINVVIRDTD